MGVILDVGLGNALVVTGLAALAAVVGGLSRRPALAHGLWVLVLAKLLIPPLVTIPVSGPSPVESSARPAVALAVEAEPIAVSEAEWEAIVGWVEPEPEAQPKPAASAAATLADRAGRWWRPAVGSAWLMGSVAWAVLAATRVRRFGRVLRAARPAPLDLQADVERLAGRLGMRSRPEVRVVDGAIAPLVWSFVGRPILLIPSGLWGRLDADGRTALLIHELAHLHRRDHWVRHLELAATALYWWHPVVWWARRALREAEEQCCDAWVVWAMPGRSRSYASALLETLDFLCEARVPAPPIAASGMNPVPPLKRRLAMILRGITPRRLPLAGKLALLALAAPALATLPSWADPPEAEQLAIKQIKIEVQPAKVVVVEPDTPAVSVEARAVTGVIRIEPEAAKAEGDPAVVEKVRIFTTKKGEGPTGIAAGGPQPDDDGEENADEKQEIRARKRVDSRVEEIEAKLMRARSVARDPMDPAILALLNMKQAAEADAKKEAESDAKKAADSDMEKTADIEIARAEVKKAEAKLRQAMAKLAKLEGKPAAMTFRFRSDNLIGDLPKIDPETMAKLNSPEIRARLRDMRVVPPLPPTPPRPPAVLDEMRMGPRGLFEARRGDVGPRDQDRRMAELEKKMERLLDVVEGLKKAKDGEKVEEREKKDKERDEDESKGR